MKELAEAIDNQYGLYNKETGWLVAWGSLEDMTAQRKEMNSRFQTGRYEVRNPTEE